MGICLQHVKMVEHNRSFFTNSSFVQYVVKKGGTQKNLPTNRFPYLCQK